ncbi:hypothetical protein E0Z10_g1492 [Xylaria hypoxylon]|uniref:Uncharacterized protein n=1 Tax=Xylaria hypoxylon TaxID=37992 RepID=A0A4Z0Z6P6_9PEZI|nr:hypothetical protein E0Z10_g1492 [Xylaria hypoxylon]
MHASQFLLALSSIADLVVATPVAKPGTVAIWEPQSYIEGLRGGSLPQLYSDARFIAKEVDKRQESPSQFYNDSRFIAKEKM